MEKRIKLTQTWIKQQPCYYDNRYYIAEGYCDRQAAVIVAGKYICHKCATWQRRHEFSKFLWLNAPLIFIALTIITAFSPWPILTFVFGVFGFTFTLGLIGKDFSFNHPGQIKSWNGFICQHCPERFLSKDTKTFINHLKKEHYQEWTKIIQSTQSLPNDKKVVKIELPTILKEHKKEIKYYD